MSTADAPAMPSVTLPSTRIDAPATLSPTLTFDAAAGITHGVTSGVARDAGRLGITSPLDTTTTKDTTTATDTITHGTRRRVRAVEYSDWYARRLTIHRWASYTTVPLFIAQYIVGERVWKYGQASNAAKYHSLLAGAVGTLFAVNTTTGVWNMIASRHDPEGRTRRIIHGTLMLIADGGFVATGILGSKAQNNFDDRTLHRKVALSSMGVALLSYAIMLPPLRRD